VIGCSSPSEPPKAPKKKNVLLITLDALRQDHVSAFGYSRQASPNIDWLALNGVAFRTVVPTGCGPRISLTSLFTSKQFTWSQLENATSLRDSSTTMAETFTAAGYQAAGFVTSPILAKKRLRPGLPDVRRLRGSSGNLRHADSDGRRSTSGRMRPAVLSICPPAGAAPAVEASVAVADVG
jgi:arylsulfatase A-like enzyme